MTTYEFFKLEKEDLLVLFWILDRHPKALYAALEYYASRYKKSGIQLNIDKIFSEFNEENGNEK